ncbi:hypothetical protein ACSBR1_003240 [Camellia fascicularis]
MAIAMIISSANERKRLVKSTSNLRLLRRFSFFTFLMYSLGIKGKMFAKKRYAEKAQMKKTLAMHEESSSRRKVDDDVQEGAIPAYLLDHETTTRGKGS